MTKILQSLLNNRFIWWLYSLSYPFVTIMYIPYLIMIHKVASEVLRTNPAKLVDLGCGAGFLVRYLRYLGWEGEYLGIDASAGMLKMARKFNPYEAFHQGPFQNIRRTDPRTVDFVVATNSLYLLTSHAEVEEVLELCLKALKPGGHLMFSVLHYVDVEGMLNAQYDLPAPKVMKNSFLRALFMGLKMEPHIIPPFFVGGIITKLVGASSTLFLDREDWQGLCEKQGFHCGNTTTHYSSPHYNGPDPGTIFLLEAPPA